MRSPGIPINVNGPLPRKYREWIRHFVDGDGACLCAEYSHLMKKHYPKLVIFDGDYNGDNHAWCQTPHGLIVDPTIAQFTTSPEAEKYHGEPQRQALHNCPRCGGPMYVNWIERCTPYCYRAFKVGDTVVGTKDGKLIVAGNIVGFKQTYARPEKHVIEWVKIECHDVTHEPGQIVAIRQNRVDLKRWTATRSGRIVTSRRCS